MTRDHDVSRRTFMKAAGTAAGAGLLGVGAGTAGAATEFDQAFANWRVREASKVWQAKPWRRGYTGRYDRTVGLTDSGIEVRHPDLGPWNGVLAREGDDGLELVTPNDEVRTLPKLAPVDLTTRTYSGTGAGAAAVGLISTTEYFTADPETDQLDATITWNVDTPETQAASVELVLQDADGNDIASSGVDGLTVHDQNTATLTTRKVTAGEQYRFSVTVWRGPANWTIDATTQRLDETDEMEARTVTTYEAVAEGDVFADPANKTFGWFDAGPRYGSYDRPRDGNGHGTHCSSIMGGSGRASVVDESSLVQEAPHATLLPTDFLAYEVDVPADGGVFVAAYGENVEVQIESPDGRTIEDAGISADHSLFDNTLIDHPAVHDSGTATYTAYVLPMQDPETDTATAGTVDRVAAGALLPAADAGDGSRDGSTSLHAGLAPDAGLVGLQGLSEPTKALGEHADEFAGTFNLRAVNMSWGYTGGLPLGAAGGLVTSTVFGENLPQRLKQIASAGILPVAAAGNAATPANGNGDPGVADEAISVAATDPVDGLTSYSSGGVGGLDEEGVSTADDPDDGDQPVYFKPEITAPGGAADGYPAGVYDLVRAAMAGVPDAPATDQPPIRDYTLNAGTSMAAPYVTGVAGLVAEAMDAEHGEAPPSIALPAPGEADYADTMRLKSTLLATATTTAFTAAPFHHPTHRPTYEFGGRDPYEGFGRVNPDAAVDAVTRDLLPGAATATDTETVAATHAGVVGLNVPEDSRAVAGYVEAPAGAIDATVEFSHYSGGNSGMAKDVPHVDLFVYDAEAPGTNGEPNVVASAMGTGGSAAVSVVVPGPQDRPETEANEQTAETRTYYVVAKLVNVPGAVNTHDVQAHLDLGLAFTAAAALDGPALSATGSRSDDGSAFTEGQTNQVDVTLEAVGTDRDHSLPGGATLRVSDPLPEGWTFLDYSDDATLEGDEVVFQVAEERGGKIRTRAPKVKDLRDGSLTFTYFVEAPDDTDEYTFGPARAAVTEKGYAKVLSATEATFGGTDTNYVAGVDTGDPVGDTSGDAEETTGDTTGTLTDTLSETL